jgi:hypothetical protein
MQNSLILLFILFCHVLFAQNLKDSLGRKQGRWTEKIKGKKVESHYKDGLLHGKQTIFQKRKGINLERNFKNGVLDSIAMEYNALSQQIISEMSFKDGLLDGYYRRYYKDGHIFSEVLFKNGALESDYKWYAPEGDLHLVFILHPSKVFFYVKEAYFENAVFFKCLTYKEPFYPIEYAPTVEDIKIEKLYSEDIIKWMKSKKTFKQRREMAEKLYNFKVTCK